MEISNATASQIKTAVSKITPLPSDKIERMLESNGWLRSKAGDGDFGNAIKAINAVRTNRMGLFICGNPGVGKSALMRVLFKLKREEISRWLYCKDEKCIGWMKNSYDFYLPRDVYVDDIGCEEVVKSYGNTSDVVGDFIQMYHERGRGRMFITSNLELVNSDAPMDLNRKYGSRVVDRIADMCVCLRLSGVSKRNRIMIG